MPTDAGLDGLLDAFADLVADRVVERLAPTLTQPERTALGLDEAANRLGVSRRSVARLIADGDLDAVSVGTRRLVPVDSIDAFLSSHRATRVQGVER